jgi:hypothetical protein
MFPADMTVFDRLERRFGWLAFPGFLRYYALFHVLVFVLQIIRPDIGQLFEFDRAKIFSGEVWRVATMFFAGSQFGTFNPVSVLLLIFAVNFVFMVSDGLEDAWGSFKTSLFYYAGIGLVLLANFVYPVVIPSSGVALFGAAFLAFATLFPKMEILLFFILPVQVRFLGILMAAGILLNVAGQPVLLPFYLVAFANYFIWAGIPALRGTALTIELGQRKKRFNASKTPVSEAFHTCSICEKTDVSHPHDEFRIGHDGEEYCGDHLPQ